MVTLSIKKDFLKNWTNALNKIRFSNFIFQSRDFFFDCWALSAKDQVLPLKEIPSVGKPLGLALFKLPHLKEEFILEESHI